MYGSDYLIPVLLARKSGGGGGGGGGTTDYNQLNNLPKIDNVTLMGNMTPSQLGLAGLKSGTTTYWMEHDSTSVSSTIYVFTDHSTSEGQNIPAIKVGDGVTHIMDLPFVASCDISEADIASWNNKVAAEMDDADDENLVLYN